MKQKFKALPKRVQDHARNLRPILDTIDRLDLMLPDNGNGQFKLPYTSRPAVHSTGWKLTFDA